jgi:ATPase subunit of ABC transporter with duplicated ATPase domains
MKYRDLVQFEPIETIVQLREASKQDYAFNLLDTYVISDRMADVLINVVFEQLQYDRQADQKGLLVVGNYGTGKSHLMSVISTIAETDGSARRLHNSNVAEKAQTIEGKFHVIREEIGATTMPLRDIVCGSIQENLAKMGVDYSFPSIDQVRSNKDAFAEDGVPSSVEFVIRSIDPNSSR